jgi:hypothetical protein
MRMRESKFGAPAGIYQARFDGVQDMPPRNPPMMGKDGRPMPDGIEWQFTVLGGEHDGQVIGRITGKEPTTANACGVLLSGIFGRPIRSDEDVDPNQFRGKTYQVVVGPSKTDPNKTYVVQVVPLTTGASVAPPAAAAPPPRSVGPVAPPAPKSSAAIKDAPDEEYWLDEGGVVSKVRASKVREAITSGKAKPTDLILMRLDQEGGWKTAADFGFDKPF